jgi:cytochrome c5
VWFPDQNSGDTPGVLKNQIQTYFEVEAVSRESTNIGFSFTILVIVAVIIIGVMKAMSGVLRGNATADMSDEAIAERIAPVAKLNTGEPIVPETASAPAPSAPAAASGGAARSGEQIFSSTCTACHGTGAMGAPKVGDAAAWAPRIDKGMDTLLNHAINGFNMMPARGTCADCSDDELKNAIEYMVSQSK